MADEGRDDYASGGEWEARAALGNVLLGLAGYYMHGWRSFAGTYPGGSKPDRDKAAALYEEARGLYAGCAVDAASPADCQWALDRARVAMEEKDFARSEPSGERRGVLLVLPAMMESG